ncbi:MAG: DUF99 family protein [Thermodesulfobacteriota bacterium]
MAEKRFSNVIGFDDAPFARDYCGKVPVVGTVYAGLRLDGLLVGEVEKDGFDAAASLARLVAGSKFLEHVQLIMLQGIALAGFNVVDVFDLHRRLNRPVLVVARKQPDMTAIQNALLHHIAGGRAKWAVIKRLGRMEALDGIFVQRVGLTFDQAAEVVDRFALYGHVPEPLRTAHLIATALGGGQSRGSP